MVEALVQLAALLAALAFVLAIVRFIIGPQAVDRVLAFDVMTTVSITGILFAALFDQRLIYLDVALVYALLSFLGGIVVARYLEKRL
jgi:multicomponent Na+:H+ antiporter subunit F